MTRDPAIRGIRLAWTLTALLASSCVTQTPSRSDIVGQWNLDKDLSRGIDPQRRMVLGETKIALIFAQEDVVLQPLNLSAPWAIDGKEISLTPKESLSLWAGLGFSRTDVSGAPEPIKLEVDWGNRRLELRPAGDKAGKLAFVFVKGSGG